MRALPWERREGLCSTEKVRTQAPRTRRCVDRDKPLWQLGQAFIAIVC